MDISVIILVILIVFISGISNILCFYIGAKLGQKKENNEEIKYKDIVPEVTLNPTKIHQKHQEEKERQKEIDKLNIIMKNIENYDGTDYKQEDVPR